MKLVAHMNMLLCSSVRALMGFAVIVLAFGNNAVYATTIGVTVDGVMSTTEVGIKEVRAALGGEAVKYYIPLTAVPTLCIYGVTIIDDDICGTSSDSGSGGTVMSMYMMFNPVSSSAPTQLEILFEVSAE